MHKHKKNSGGANLNIEGAKQVQVSSLNYSYYRHVHVRRSDCCTHRRRVGEILDIQILCLQVECILGLGERRTDLGPRPRFKHTEPYLF